IKIGRWPVRKKQISLDHPFVRRTSQNVCISQLCSQHHIRRGQCFSGWIGPEIFVPHHGHSIVISFHINLQRNSDLPQIPDAHRRFARLFCATQRRHQQRRQNRDDRNHHQQFNQRERQSGSRLSIFSFRQGAHRPRYRPPPISITRCNSSNTGASSALVCAELWL